MPFSIWSFFIKIIIFQYQSSHLPSFTLSGSSTSNFLGLSPLFKHFKNLNNIHHSHHLLPKSLLHFVNFHYKIKDTPGIGDWEGCGGACCGDSAPSDLLPSQITNPCSKKYLANCFLN